MTPIAKNIRVKAVIGKKWLTCWISWNNISSNSSTSWQDVGWSNRFHLDEI